MLKGRLATTEGASGSQQVTRGVTNHHATGAGTLRHCGARKVRLTSKACESKRKQTPLLFYWYWGLGVHSSLIF